MSDDVSRRIQERRARLQAEKERMEKRKMRFALVGQLVFLPLCVLYMELLFHISSRGVFTISSVLLILLFAYKPSDSNATVSTATVIVIVLAVISALVLYVGHRRAIHRRP